MILIGTIFKIISNDFLKYWYFHVPTCFNWYKMYNMTFSETGSEQGWEFNFIYSIALFLIVNERISFPSNSNACTYRFWHFKNSLFFSKIKYKLTQHTENCCKSVILLFYLKFIKASTSATAQYIWHSHIFHISLPIFFILPYIVHFFNWMNVRFH